MNEASRKRAAQVRQVQTVLNDAADLIEVREWGGPGAVMAAAWSAFETRNGTGRGFDDVEVIDVLAAYLYATTFAVVDALRVHDCAQCVICGPHTGGPLSNLNRTGTCPGGCRLCDQHAGAVEHRQLYSAEDVLGEWECLMDSGRIVAAVLRAAADDHGRP